MTLGHESMVERSGRVLWPRLFTASLYLPFIVFTLVYCPAQAGSAVLAKLVELESPSLIWSAYQSLRIFGLPAYQRSFISNESGQSAVRALALHTDLFQRAVVFKNKTVLSGLQSDWHWVAEIDSGAFGSTGLVSALLINRSELDRALNHRSALTLGWLPQRAQLRFSQRVTVFGRSTVQQIYSSPLVADQLHAYVQKRLRLEGWVDQTHLAWLPDTSVWRRKTSELTLSPAVSQGGSTLFVQLVE